MQPRPEIIHGDKDHIESRKEGFPQFADICVHRYEVPLISHNPVDAPGQGNGLGPPQVLRPIETALFGIVGTVHAVVVHQRDTAPIQSGSVLVQCLRNMTAHCACAQDADFHAPQLFQIHGKLLLAVLNHRLFASSFTFRSRPDFFKLHMPSSSPAVN